MNAEEIEHRFNFHPATTDEKRDAHASMREACKQTALRINNALPDGREKSLAITHLEDAMMWANAGLARNNTEGAQNANA